jgi:hypothetical protein
VLILDALLGKRLGVKVESVDMHNCTKVFTLLLLSHGAHPGKCGSEKFVLASGLDRCPLTHLVC